MYSNNNKLPNVLYNNCYTINSVDLWKHNADSLSEENREESNDWKNNNLLVYKIFSKVFQ